MKLCFFHNTVKYDRTPVRYNGNTLEPTTTISEQGRHAASKIKELSSKYDVTSISANERAKLSGELLESGLINNEVALYMTAPSSIDMDPEQKMNFYQSANEALIFAKQHGASRKQVDIQEKAVSILTAMYQLSGSAWLP